MLGEISYSVAADRSVCATRNRRIEMIRWLLFAAFAFLVTAALQGVMASRRAKKPVEGQDPLPTLPPLPYATELENSRRELEALEQRLDIHNTGQQGRGA
jgi:hypothetical protein